MKNIILTINSLGLLFVSNFIIQDLNYSYELKPTFLFILLLNYQTIVRLYIWLLNTAKKISKYTIAKTLMINYLLGFLLYLSSIVGLIIHQINVNKVDVLMGAVPLGLYLTLGAAFVLHGINYLLLFFKTRKMIIILVLSYFLNLIIQFILIHKSQGTINIFLTPIFFMTWTTVLLIIGIKNWKNAIG